MKRAAEIRMDLARGHAVLGEHLEALQCLERAVQEDPRAPGLLALVEELLEVWGMDRDRVACRAAGQALREQLLQLLEGAAAAAPAEPTLPPAGAAGAALELEDPEDPGAAGEAEDPGEADLLEAEPLEAEPLDAEVLEAEAYGEEPGPEGGGQSDDSPLQPSVPPVADFDWDEPARAAGVDEEYELDEPAAPAPGPSLPEASGVPEAEDPLGLPQEPPPGESAEARVARVRELERWLGNARDSRSRA